MIPKATHHDQEIKEIPKTINDFFYNFFMTYHEHNYSLSREKNNAPYEMLILQFCHSLIMDQISQEEEF